MAYIGQVPATGENNSFKILDDISSYTLTFDGSSASVVSTVDNTITQNNHRFITAQRVTYTAGGGTAIGGLTDGGVYYIIKNDQNTIKLATSETNALNNAAIDLNPVGTGTAHTLTVAFDGINTKFKATYDNGTKAQISRAAQLQISINGVIQQPNDSTTPVNGFGFDLDSVIIFSTAPIVSDVFWGNLVANNFPTFDISDNTVDSFTGNGAQINFTLSKIPANNQNVLVTLDGVVQYPSDATVTRAYSVSENVLTFVSAPGNNVEIQVRHIGFAGATSSSVTGFYGRTGNVGLTTADTISVGAATIGVGAAGTSLLVQGNARVTGILTIGTSSITLDGSNNQVNIGTGVTIHTTNGFQVGSNTLSSSGLSVGSINSSGIITAVNFVGNVTGNVNSTGVTTFTELRVGTAVTISGGIVTATSYRGDGSQLTGVLVGSGITVSGGIVTAVSYSGDGSQLTGLNAGVFAADNTSNLYSCTISSLPSRTTGFNNFFVGTNAGKSITSGNNNIGIGTSAGASITTGCNNNFLGRNTGRCNTAGQYNNFFGYYAGQCNTTGVGNNFLGQCAGHCNTTGCNNVFIGALAGVFNTTASNNNFIGQLAGGSTTGSNNNFFGICAGRFNTTGNNNNFLGACAGAGTNLITPNTGTHNNFFGCNAGRVNSTGSCNNFLGFNAGRYNTTGYSNVFIGEQAGYTNTDGIWNVFIGHRAGYENTTSERNNFIGRLAGFCNTSGGYNNFFGSEAGNRNTTGFRNNFIGDCAGRFNTTGSCNNFMGRNAGNNNTTASHNNFFGTNAGRYNTTGGDNNFFGRYSGYCNTTGDNNNFFGTSAGRNTTGACNTFLGRYAGCSNTTGSHNVAIGNNAQLPSATGSCQLVIGSSGVNWLYGDSSGNVGLGLTNPSVKLQVDGSDIEIRASNNANSKNISLYGGSAANDPAVTYTGNLRFYSNSAGAERARINTSGHFVPGADNTYDLGSTSLRWANIYSADLQMSNEGSSNEVDGTWGSYTIQEGENDLFLINRRTGKRYKFLLEEVK